MNVWGVTGRYIIIRPMKRMLPNICMMYALAYHATPSYSLYQAMGQKKFS